VTLVDGTRVASACTVWVAGAAAPPVVADSPLPHDAGGFLRVDATLRAADGAPVWGAGDCIALDGAPWMPRSGVHAVRQGPVLAHNLRAALEGRPPRAYRPQRASLALLATGDDRAILSWRGVAAEGAWVWRLKDAIDRRWMRRYGVADR
jgi:NADH dehydrogenase FAD-containing subunit